MSLKNRHKPVRKLHLLLPMAKGIGLFLKILVLILGLTALIAIEPVYAHGGGDGSGGGIVWNCTYGYKATPYLADVAEESLDATNLMLTVMDNEGFQYIENALNLTEKGLGDQVRERIRLLNFHGTHQKLELLNDDKLPLETTIQGRRCVKAQLAIQNFKTGKVTYNIELYKGLGLGEQALFIVHEALVSLQERQFGNTVPIRAEMFAAASENITSILTHLGHRSLLVQGQFKLPEPLEGRADLAASDVPTDAQVEALYPQHLDAPYYTCERSQGSYLLCGQGPGSCDFVGGYQCSPKAGIRQFGSEATVIRVDGVLTGPGPDNNFYVPEDQIDKVDAPVGDPIR